MDVPSRGDRLRYHLDRFLSWHPFARFIALFVLSFVLIFICAVLAKIAMPAPTEPGESFDLFEALWWALTRVADAGTMGDDKGTLVRFVAILASISGVVVVALLIGLVSGTVGDKIDDLRKGRSPVIDHHHTLILGYGEKIFALLKELRAANANQKSAAVVVLSTVDKEEVENALRERLPDLQTTRVIVRQGSPFSVQDLKKVGAGRAKSIIILASEEVGPDGQGEQSDMDAIKSLLALRRIDGALTTNYAVVEMHDASRREVAEKLGNGGVEVVAMDETLSRMMVQTARQNGLAEVYREVLTYAGSEFYFAKVGALKGITFGEAQWKVNGAVVCGLRRHGAKGSTATELNPGDEVVLSANDELLVLAEDDDSFSFGASHQVTVSPGFLGAPAVAPQPERLLICADSPKLADMLKEFDNYLMAGSEAWLMPGTDQQLFMERLTECVGQLKRVKVRFLEGDPTSPEALRQVAFSQLSVAMVVSDTRRSIDEADAHTVMTVLLLRDAFKKLGDVKPRIISEIIDPRTKDLLEQEYGADFVVSSEMTSMLLAQVSERRELNGVFGDLFDADGNEIYLKRAACYAVLGSTTPWLAVQKVARLRGEVAVGYIRFGQKPLLNPSQQESLVLSDQDRIIVIAQDESEAPVVSKTVVGAVAKVTEKVPRSALLPPEPAADPRAVSAGPRVQGPSTMPRAPLPGKKT